MDSLELNGDNTLCGNIFISLDNFTSKGKITINCSFCEGQFEGFSQYTNHLLMQHYPKIELDDCSKDINYTGMKGAEVLGDRENTNDFLRFLQMDLNKNNTKNIFLDVQEATETYENPQILFQENHKTSNETSNSKTIKNKECPHCERKFFLSSSLKHHLERHRNVGSSTSGLYKCNICKSEFDLRFSLMLHIREHKMRKNIQREPLSVEYESKIVSKLLRKKENVIQNTSFSKNTALDDINVATQVAFSKAHVSDFDEAQSNFSEHGNELNPDVISNTTIEPEEFYCEVCNKIFFGQSRFNAHMNRHKPCEFKCKICFKEFKTSAELQTHTRFHTGERPYLCSSCGETFVTVSNLIIHTRRHHTFERTKQCPICKKKFYGTGELKGHLQSTHSNERPYKCKLCTSTFKRSFSLRTHIKSHENKREYKCILCPASFNQKCNLTAHKRKAHCLVPYDEKRA